MTPQTAPRRADPPASPAIERAVIGAALLDYEGLRAEGLGSLTAADYFLPVHTLAWRAIERVAATGTPVSVLTVAHALAEAGEIDDFDALVAPDYCEPYLVGCWGDCASAVGASAWARIVHDYAERRRAIARGSAIVRDAYDGKTQGRGRGGVEL